MHKRYAVTLTETERTYLKQMIAAGTDSARKLIHARILLKADQGPNGPAWVDDAIAEAVEVSQPTVSRIRKQYVHEGLQAALNRRAPQREYLRKLDGEQEAKLIALACSKPPKGEARWTLRLLADKLVELEITDTVSYQTVRRILKKTISNRTSRNNGASRPNTTRSSSGASKTSSMSTLVPTIRSDPKSAWTRCPSNSSKMSVIPCR
jgi:transposase